MNFGYFLLCNIHIGRYDPRFGESKVCAVFPQLAVLHGTE